MQLCVNASPIPNPFPSSSPNVSVEVVGRCHVLLSPLPPVDTEGLRDSLPSRFSSLSGHLEVEIRPVTGLFFFLFLCLPNQAGGHSSSRIGFWYFFLLFSPKTRMRLRPPVYFLPPPVLVTQFRFRFNCLWSSPLWAHFFFFSFSWTMRVNGTT